MRVILYVFAGRRANLEVASPFYQRVAAQYPHIEIHLWDLCRNPEDSRYLRSLATDRIQVRAEFYDRLGRSARGQTKVWQHYTSPDYRDCVFLKLDDDALFIETEKLESFGQAAAENPDHVVSAQVINNGSCTRLFPDIWAGYQQLGIPLLDVHTSAEYAELSHRWFFQHWRTVINQPAELTLADTWCSINAISYTYEMGCKIAAAIGTRSPDQIADRHYPRRNQRGRPLRHTVGDEGSVNMQNILIHQGFTVGHLTFGPQDRAMDDSLLTELRKNYADIGRQYLEP